MRLEHSFSRRKQVEPGEGFIYNGKIIEIKESSASSGKPNPSNSFLGNVNNLILPNIDLISNPNTRITRVCGNSLPGIRKSNESLNVRTSKIEF